MSISHKNNGKSFTIQGMECNNFDNTNSHSDNHYACSLSFGDKHKKTKTSKGAQWFNESHSFDLEKDPIVPLHIRFSCKVKKGINVKKVNIGEASISFEARTQPIPPETVFMTISLYDEEKKQAGKMKIKITLVGVAVIHEIFYIIKECKEKGVTPLEEFLKSAEPEEVNVRLPKIGNSPLHEACIEKEEQLLNALLKYNKIDVNIKNEDGNTPLHYFCAKWTSPDYLTPFKLFIERGARVNELNSNGETPIFKAIFNNFIRSLLMEALIGQGAKVNLVTKTREGLLHYAVRLNRADLVRLILQNTPTLDSNSEGETAWDLVNNPNSNVHPAIKKILQQIRELFTWLEDNDLSELKELFIKNEMTVSLLADVNDAMLIQMGIEKIGTRMKCIKACEKEKEAIKKREEKELTMPSKEITEEEKTKIEAEISKLDAQGDGFLDGSALEYTKHLGTGAAGDVYKGLYNNNVVAIKVLSVKSAEKEVDEFKKEFKILRAVRNPHVVKFIGVAMKPLLCMVMEYCARGSLHHVLKDQACTIGWNRAIVFCKETCFGLHALHSNNPVILHRDLKSLNLLVTQEWKIKIADFGLSRFNTAENLETMRQMRGTYQYLDPEVYNGGTFKPPSDIYSMSLIFWEIVMRVLTGSYHQPYAEFKNLQYDFQIIVQSARENLRPSIPQKCPSSFKELIVSCWSRDQVARPSLDSIIKSLECIEEEYKTKSTEWDAK